MSKLHVKCIRCGLVFRRKELELKSHYCQQCDLHGPIITYTHQDEEGMLWRFVGSRPTSALADKVMLDCGMDPLK